MTGRNRQSGFTLIELMIVVAIVGILASVAMPQFRDYSARAKVTEALVQLTNCRNIIQEVYLSANSSPGAGLWGCEAENPSKFVERITTDADGKVYLTLGGAIGDLRLSQKDITYTPIASTGLALTADDVGTPVRSWRCGSTADGTDLNVNFLPSSCRGN